MAFLAAAAPLLGTIGTVVGAGATLAGGLYGAQVASNNATVAKQNANYTLEAGQVQAQDQSIKNSQEEAKQKTAFAANGIDVNSGSAATVQASQKMTDDLDIERILQEAGLRATGYNTQASNDEAQSSMDALEGITGSAATLLEKAPSLSSKWGSGSGSDNSSSWSQARNGVFG